MGTPEQDAPLVELRFDRPPPTTMKTARDALSTAQEYVIDSPQMYELAAHELKDVMALLAKVEGQRTSITGPINKALKAVNALFAEPTAWLEQARDILKNRMLAYQQAEQRRRAEEQRRLEAAAAAERARLAEEAAAALAKAEAEAEAMRKKAAAAKKKGDAETAARLESQADTRAQQGAVTAQVLEQTQALMSAPSSTIAAPKVSGISTRKLWAFRITDPALIPREYLLIDEQKIGGVVRALKDATNIPGVEAYQKDSLASRAG
jgi:colicin import membrane protein